MKISKIIFTVCCLLWLLPANGQNRRCYDEDKLNAHINEDRVKAFLKTRSIDKGTRNEEMDTIIVNPIILRKGDGSDPSVDVEQLILSIEAANEYFEFTRIHFAFCGQPTYFDDDEFYNLSIEEGRELNQLLHVSNTINIYVAETISESFPDGTVGLFCGIASFPKPETDLRYILLDGSCLQDITLLAHELGHFYGLFHTHETAFGEELVSKVNCEIAGDFLCDTPADPLLNSSNVVNCRYFGQDVDPMGDSYRPDPKNIMSYAPQDCRSIFSWQQLFKMRDVHLNENSYLLSTCDFPDFTVKIDTFFAAFRPGQIIDLPLVINNLGSQKVFGLDIHAYISDEPNTRVELLSSTTILFPGDQTQLNLRMKLNLPVDLPETTQYIIIDLDESQALKELDESNNSATLAYKVDYGTLEDVSVYPNPVNSRTRIFIRNESMKGKVFIDIYDTEGKLIIKETRIKQFETLQVELNTEFLLPGLYLAMIRVEDSKPFQVKIVKM